MKKQDLINSVKNAPGSIFTKDDVIGIINSLTQDDKTKNILDLIEMTITRVLNNNDYVDYNNVEYGIDYDNRIEVTNIEIDKDSLIRDILSELDEEFVKVEKEYPFSYDETK
jgi:hypothetical protein